MAVADDGNPYLRDPPTDFTPVAELDAATASEQIELLRAAIREHDRLYYIENDPIIADRIYDQLFDRLRDLESHFDEQVPTSPTMRVGGEPLDEFETVEHVAPMLSIDQSGDETAVREFDARIKREVEGDFDGYVCEPKFDGVSLEFVYQDGTLDRAVTRGDGTEGDDVTANARTIHAVPLELRDEPPSYLAVRGEVYMPKDAFQSYNRERIERGDDPFANPRNATAGTIRQLDPSVVAERPLSVFFFDVLDAAAIPESHWEALGDFREYGLRTNEYVERVGSIDEAIDYRDELLERREELPYEIDGVVIKVNDRSLRERLGQTARHDRWAFAYKFPARSEVTRIADVAVQVGRTGRVTPVALLDPVDVGGVTVSRASLHNPSEIAEKNVNVGDRVRVQRAGDVIPYVEEVVEKSSEGHYRLPDQCPVCDSAIERDGPMAFCTGGLSCDAQRKRSIEYYASEDGLDIEGLGERSIEQLTDAGLVETIADLYRLDVFRLTTLEGWGETSARNLIEELDDAREPPLDAFISALGVPQVGPTTARSIAHEFGTFEAVRETAIDEPGAFEAIDDIGDSVAAAVHDFFTNPANATVIDDLLENVSPQPIEDDRASELEGLTFVFTGGLSSMTRSEAQSLVEAHGANATSSVSGNTDFLVIGENPGERKRSEAAEHDVDEIDEDAFLALLADYDIDVNGA